MNFKVSIWQIVFVLMIAGISAWLGFQKGRYNTQQKIAECNDAKVNILTETLETQPEPEWQEIEMNVSAYCPCARCCGVYSDGYTANNHKIQEGDKFVAAPKNYPFGTEMIIPGYNEGRAVKVLDRGGAIKDNKLDLFFPTHKEALIWGRQHLTVKVKM